MVSMYDGVTAIDELMIISKHRQFMHRNIVAAIGAILQSHHSIHRCHHSFVPGSGETLAIIFVDPHVHLPI